MGSSPVGCCADEGSPLACNDSAMHPGDGARSRVGRPYRRFRRWSRHTPNDEMALVVITLGVVLIFVAAMIAVLAA